MYIVLQFFTRQSTSRQSPRVNECPPVSHCLRVTFRGVTCYNQVVVICRVGNELCKVLNGLIVEVISLLINAEIFREKICYFSNRNSANSSISVSIIGWIFGGSFNFFLFRF